MILYTNFIGIVIIAILVLTLLKKPFPHIVRVVMGIILCLVLVGIAIFLVPDINKGKLFTELEEGVYTNLFWEDHLVRPERGIPYLTKEYTLIMKLGDESGRNPRLYEIKADKLMTIVDGEKKLILEAPEILKEDKFRIKKGRKIISFKIDDFREGVEYCEVYYLLSLDK